MSRPSNTEIIEARELTRRFQLRRKGSVLRGTVTAVEKMTFTIAADEAVGYIGANGTGKSTTIKMLIGILVPAAGAATTCGLDPLRQRKQLARKVGVVFGQRSQLWWDLPVRESFAILSDVHRMPSSAPDHAPTSWSRNSIWPASGTPRFGNCPSASGCAPRSLRHCCTPSNY